MVEEGLICPYPGLRTFTEEESIFFKGRDEHIRKASNLLEHRKFLMITGASGEGKSSIVYAGIVPFARGGFIKSEYSNWAVVDFRPERSPMENFSNCLEDAFTDLDQGVIKTNLGKGFSSLVALYKNSPLYVDTGSDEWKDADEKGQKMIRRKAANLLIIVDQFEEFFTNSENYVNGVPSDESALVVSTLLETARIAARDNLPIYIVFTMRSDFIGQCAAFRGLPEFIGYSQFFVPRLKRVDLKRVIQEPAGLSGVVIKERLVERLLYDLVDGVDQLPILQHALNRVWGLAVERGEELDLLHYAMAGGLDKEDLRPEDRAKFMEWFNQLDPRLRNSYQKPELHNVLDTHANQLYYLASANGKHASHILEISFKCLTTVDEERAVRNRMTLDDITNVLDDPEIQQSTVDDVLRIFRQEGNTFLKPYVDPETGDFEQLNDESVLDITHESLIRNWERLRDWAHQENRDHEVLEELMTQMNHWVNNGKSSAFLLSSGSLNYFEEWYNRVDPNKHWIWRYIKGSPGADMVAAEQMLTDIHEFIRKSINKNFVPRLFSRYGMYNVIASIGTTLLVIAAIYFTISSRSVQNDHVMELVKEEGIALIKAKKVNPNEEAAFLVSLMRYDSVSFYQYLDSIADPQEKFDQINEILAWIIRRNAMINSAYTQPLLERGAGILDSLLSSEYEPEEVDSDLLRPLLEFQTKVSALKSFNDDPGYDEIYMSLAGVGLDFIRRIFKTPEYYNLTSIWFWQISDEMYFGIDAGVLNAQNRDSLLSAISIFRNPSVTAYKFYPNDSTSNNQIYDLLINLHALNGELDLAKQCIDSSLQEFADQIPLDLFDNNRTVRMFYNFYKGNDVDGLRDFINHMASLTGFKQTELYSKLFQNLISSEVNIVRSGGRPNNIHEPFPNLANIEEGELLDFLKLYEEELEAEQRDPVSKFELAQFYKFSGLLVDKYWTIQDRRPNQEWLNRQFDKSLELWNDIKDDISQRWDYTFNYFKDRNLPTARRITLSDVYKYPDYLVESMDNRMSRFYSDAFFRYLVENELAASMYEGRGIFPFYLWIQNSNWSKSTTLWSDTYAADNDIPAKIRIAGLLDSMKTEEGSRLPRKSLAKLSAAYYSAWSGDEETAMKILSTLDPTDIIDDYEGRTTFEMYFSYLADMIYDVNDTIPDSFFEAEGSPFVNGGKAYLMLVSVESLTDDPNFLNFFNHLNNSYELFNEYLKDPYHQYGATSLEYAAIPGLIKLNSLEMLIYVDKVVLDAEEMNLGRNFKLSAVRNKVKSLVRNGQYFEAHEMTKEASINSRIILFKYMMDQNFHQNADEEDIRDWRRYDRNMRDANFVTEEM